MIRKVAYLTSRFPKASETFVLYELLEIQKLGTKVDVFSLIRQQDVIQHPEVEMIRDSIHYVDILSLDFFSAQFYWLFRSPLRYLTIWFKVIMGNLGSLKFLGRALVATPKAANFAREIEKMGIEHIHAHWATHPTLCAYVISQLTAIPYSFTGHAHDIYVERSMLEEKIRASKFMATISQYNKKFLRELYGDIVDEKVHVVHCGVDTSVFQPRTKQKPNEVFTIITVARLHPMKGHRYLVEACKILADKGIDFHCHIVGDGELRDEIANQVSELGLQEQVQLLGLQARPRVLELLAQADVMVLPSVVIESGKKEGIPVSLMEALAMKVPTIATDISGISELIINEETGLLVSERDAIALAKALERIHDNPDGALQLSTKGLEKVIREFNQATNAGLLQQLMSSDSISQEESVAQHALT